MPPAVKDADAPTEAPVASQDQPLAPDALAIILAQFDKFSERLDGIESRQKATERATPRFVPMERPQSPRQIMDSLKVGQEAEGTRRQLPVGTHGLRLEDHVQRSYPQAFQPGDPVRINPETIRNGANTPWSVALDKLGIDGEGTVRKVMWLSKWGEWKYKVRVPGLTGRTGDGFYQNELLPA